VDVEITTAHGSKLHTLSVSKDNETFSLPADSAPLLVLFDKGAQILKVLDFHKEKKEWIYQLQHAADVADRADAAVALAKLKNDEEAVTALGNALNTDKAWGVRDQAADALGKIGGASAAKQLLEGLNANEQPFVRNYIAAALGNIKDDTKVASTLESIAREDRSYRARANALQSLGRLKAPNALASLTAGVNSDSPDGFVRNAALRSFGYLGDDKGVPLLREWSAPGKPIDSRMAAIASLARLDKDNKEITKQIAGYLAEPRFPIRYSAIMALGARGDASAIPALEALLKSQDLSIEMAPAIKEQIAHLQKPKGEKGEAGTAKGDDSDNEGETGQQAAVISRLDKLEHLVQEMNERLKSIEAHVSGKASHP
jgi:aminopeptidase N